MASSNHERVGKALELLKTGLSPFVDRELKSAYQGKTATEIVRFMGDDRPKAKRPVTEWDVALLLRVMWEAWNEVFRNPLGQAERSLVSELRDVRNKWAHQEPFSSDDAYRALDSVGRLLAAVSAPEATELDKAKTELLRLRFDEQMRTEKRRSTGSAIEAQTTSMLPPWREVITPHKDVASGHYQQAEFAADLWQVHLGEGSDEYRDPAEFFRRTYLTESLKHLLIDGIRRITTGGGDPVVQLQTSFGGGKTHSMLALYHLFSGTKPSDLAGVESILTEAGPSKLPHVNRIVLVGHKISPGRPSRKADGTLIRTIWGELAWQLGESAGGPSEAKKAYKQIKEDDERATNPGDTLRELFNKYGPCLILIDEWVAYARQLHDRGDLPGGNFETQFSFAQALTEAARAAKNCLLVISLPASDAGIISPHIQADDTEVGGQRGREALERLRNVVGRLESSWRPATAEEGFEIVRRRLFEPLTDKTQYARRDMVARAFHELYRTQQQEFPPECRDADYEKRLIAAYPIHPEVFDRLYNDWSSLLKFQRTRGVLRLMAAVIHSLWDNGDRNPMILPANIPIDDRHVQFELTRYLSDNWAPVVEKDVDGPNAYPVQLDRDVPNLGKYAACRRVARTIYMGSAPTATAAHKGIEDRRIKLGCVIPGESPAIFGDALRRLASTSTHLYQDGPRYWYSTQPTVTKLAEDRAAQLERNPDKVAQEIERRLRVDLRREGDFSRIHALPQSGQDVPDDLDARLVVLGVSHPYHKDGNSPAEVAAKALLESRGASPRQFQNTLTFLAVDRTRLQELDAGARLFLAWESILADKEPLDLSPFQVKQAETQKAAADATVAARLPEAYQWLLVPTQATPQTKMSWQALKLTGQDPLAVRASKKLRNDELLVTGLGATRLRMELDRVPLWRGEHVPVKQLVEDFAKYPYLPRLKAPDVLLKAIREGLSLLSWQQDTFAYAESFDEATKRYLALRCGQIVHITEADLVGILVKPEIAAKQRDAEAATTTTTQKPPTSDGTEKPGTKAGTSAKLGPPQPDRPAPPVVKRYHGTVDLNSARVGLDAGRIAEEVIAHLVGLVGANVKVTLEIEAEVQGGVPEQVVRTVTENSQTLKFSSHGFEAE